MYALKEILGGSAYDVYALVVGGRCPLEEFMKDLPLQDQKKLMALFGFVAARGRPMNVEKFRHLEGPLWELQSYQVRIPCFFDGSRMVILTQGFAKKKNKTPRTEIVRALRMIKEYFGEKR